MEQISLLQSTVPPVEGRLHRSVSILPVIRPDRIKAAKTLVEKAVKLRKVFSVQGPYPVIRAALLARGWVERLLPQPVQRTLHCHGDQEEDGDDHDVMSESADESRKAEYLDDMYDLTSRLVRNEMTHFYWTTRRDDVDYRSLRHDQMTNHYANAGTFTTKVGLCVNLRNLQWFDTADPDTFFPRCYRLGAEDEKQAFIEDFRRTACTSLLQHVAEINGWRRNGTEESENVELPFVGPGIIGMALQVCQQFLSALEHHDIDATVETSPMVNEQKWADFLQDYYKVVHEGARIRGSSVFVERCQAMLVRLQMVCPQLDTDGLNNIWIIKPGAKSRGRGIVCMDRLDEIVALVDTDRSMTKECKWVIQKYLERPLLIHGTKFDLRQWFLVTDWNPLTVWFYRECYLRFSTKPYSTKTLDSSVHLCNNSIQKHFQPARDRHPGVPEDNMWSCSQFRAFLRHQGRGEEWESKVVPGMQQALVRALLTAQDLVEPRKASFELYGADFVLGRDLRPWLLEINASPTMGCSTAVTARLCPAVQLDTLRVVLDRRTDPSAYTGGFNLIYKQAAVEVPQYMGLSLLVEGARLRRLRPAHRQTVLSNLPITIPTDQSSSQEDETAQKPSGQIFPASSFHCSCKGKKKQLSSKSASPKRGHRGTTEVHNTSHVCKSHFSLAFEQPLVIQSEPQRKAQRLGVGTNGISVVPWSLSFSLSSRHGTSGCKRQMKPDHDLHISRTFLRHTAVEPRQRTSSQVVPSLQVPLPALKVFSLRPNIASGIVANRSPQTCIHNHQSFLCTRRQSKFRFKGEHKEEHTI
ncbi:tubulin monoglycylase TTLL3 isoform X2 [Antennarius striatus]|uniref:tubulin monoglycylase TTLL3 isoform X2 n=1 Tax=Antennarius striatus TaxID=241820 RepID=UPI0035AF5589